MAFNWQLERCHSVLFCGNCRRFRLAVKSSILRYFVAVILKVLLVNLLAALNFANIFKNKKRLENKKKR